MMMAGIIAKPQYTNYFHLTPVNKEMMNASMWEGSIISCFFMQYLAAHLSRKKTICFASLLIFIRVALQTASTSNMGILIFARVVLGFCT